jgi:adenosylcobinamide-GDP ribazoletransferase
VSARGLILAVQFLTRVPTPQVRDFEDRDLARCAVWFPLVGALVGAAVAVPLVVADDRPWLAAVLALVVWVAITGALHLDGLADVADGLGAAHRDPTRFAAVVKDPHLGAFGVVTVVVQLLVKVVLLHELAGGPWAWSVVLVPAWARWSTLVVSRWLPPLQAGMAERFAWRLRWSTVAAWAVLLAGVSAWAAPTLLVALPLTPLAGLYWRRRLGGISGDCLGATTEVLESLLLLALVLAPSTLA